MPNKGPVRWRFPDVDATVFARRTPNRQLNSCTDDREQCGFSPRQPPFEE